MEHVPGYCNYLSDSLSRLQLQKFLQLCPDTDIEATVPPPSLWTLF